MNVKQLLIIGLVWPEPTSTAAGIRMCQLMDFFTLQGYQITVASAAGTSDNSLDLEGINITQKKIILNDPSFDDFITTLKPSVVIFDRFLIEEQYGWRVAEHCPTALRILDTEDLHFLRNARHKALKKGITCNDDLLFTDDAKREIASIYRCDLSLIISTVEMDLLKNTFNIDESLLFYLPFLSPKLPTDIFSSYPKFNERIDFMTIGNFRHAPNWQSILYLKQEIWPLIRKKLPKAVIHIYGSYVTPKARQLHNLKEGFIIEGFVQNSNEAFKKAKVCLSSLQFGAGLKGKLFDAMLQGTPSVTSSVGAEGMHGILPWNGAITNVPEDFANEAIHLYQNDVAWRKAQKNGLEIINTLFNQEEYHDRFANTLQSLLKELKKHRLQNFIGAMLQHHTLKSTKYFSQWIAEKNR